MVSKVEPAGQWWTERMGTRASVYTEGQKVGMARGYSAYTLHSCQAPGLGSDEHKQEPGSANTGSLVPAYCWPFWGRS